MNLFALAAWIAVLSLSSTSWHRSVDGLDRVFTSELYHIYVDRRGFLVLDTDGRTGVGRPMGHGFYDVRWKTRGFDDWPNSTGVYFMSNGLIEGTTYSFYNGAGTWPGRWVIGTERFKKGTTHEKK